MPLVQSDSRDAVSDNIRRLRSEGRPQAQSVAIALDVQRRNRHAFGGGIGHAMSPSQGTPWWTREAAREMQHTSPGKFGHFAAGGMMSPSEASPWWERASEREMVHPDIPFGGGLIGGSGAGRTDRVPLSVGSGSHVIPADVVSSLGQGATDHGGKIMAAALGGGTGPWGVPLPHAVHGHGVPHPPGLSGMSSLTSQGLGNSRGGTTPTSILAASAEYVVPPGEVEDLGRRAIEQGMAKRGENAADAGHRLLDEMIARVRADQIKWLRHAPAPKK